MQLTKHAFYHYHHCLGCYCKNGHPPTVANLMHYCLSLSHNDMGAGAVTECKRLYSAYLIGNDKTLDY